MPRLRPAVLAALPALLAAGALCGCASGEEEGASASASPVAAVVNLMSVHDDEIEADQQRHYEAGQQEREEAPEGEEAPEVAEAEGAPEAEEASAVEQSPEADEPLEAS